MYIIHNTIGCINKSVNQFISGFDYDGKICGLQEINDMSCCSRSHINFGDPQPIPAKSNPIGKFNIDLWAYGSKAW